MHRLAALLILLAPPAFAQDWATREVCFSDPQPVTAEDVLPHDLAALEAEAARIPNARGRLWRIDHPSGGTSHLWGTMHVSLAEVLDLPDVLKAAIESARLVAIEIDFTYPDRSAMDERYDEPGRYRGAGDAFLPEKALDLSYLGSTIEAAVIQHLAGSDYGEELLYVMTYAGLAEHLLSDPCEAFVSGVIPAQDNFIQTLAHIAGVELRGLESPSELIADLAKDPETAKAMIALYASFLPPPERLQNFNASVQLYLEGRLGLMTAWEAAHMRATYGPQGIEALDRTDAYLLTLRNERFVTRIADELAAGGVVLAVGAGHLPGETGLVELLRAKGHTVTRIPLLGEQP